MLTLTEMREHWRVLCSDWLDTLGALVGMAFVVAAVAGFAILGGA